MKLVSLAVPGWAAFVAVCSLSVSVVAAAGSQLEFIPADTFFYTGNTKPYPFVRVLKQLSYDPDALVRMIQKAKAAEENGAADGQDDGMSESEKKAQRERDERVEAFFRTYADFLRNPAARMAEYGFPEDLLFSVYMSGLAPVMRIGLADAEKFVDAVAAFEQENAIISDIKQLGGVEYRRYGGAGEPSDQERDVAIVIAVVGDDAVLTVDFGDESKLEAALGITQPVESFATQRVARKIDEQWGYSGHHTWLIDFRKLVSLLTASDSEGGKHFDALLSLDNAPSNIRALRTPECRQELEGLASTWPRLIGGYRAFDVSEDNFALDMHSAVEVNDPQLIGTLQKFRGYIPEPVREDDGVFTLAIGLDVSRLGQTLTELSGYMQQTDYKCALLSGLNELASPKTAALFMSAGIMSKLGEGIKGVSVSLYGGELDASGEAPTIRDLDALVSIVSMAPETLLESIKAIAPLAGVDVPADGTAVDLGPHLASQLGQEVDLKLARKGNQIAMFAGDTGAHTADRVASESVTDNGLLYFGANMRALMQKLAGATKLGLGKFGQSEEEFMPAYELMIQTYPDGYYGYFIDVTPKGIELGADVSLGDNRDQGN